MRIFLIAALTATSLTAAGKPELGPLIAQAFGPRFQLDPLKVRQALAQPDQFLPFDEDADGGIDTFYFVDHHAKHTKEFLPIVVKAIAPTGNFKDNKFSWTHAMFLADWRGDASADRVVGHLDDDGDGDIDRMLLASPWHDYFGPLHLVLAEDIGDDNRLWFHRNFWTDTDTYWWRSDFNGDEVFHFFTFNPATNIWDQKGEGPFAFYDHDHDGFSDEIVRRDTSIGDHLTSVRWSFDLDRDANEFQVHDYDLSISGYGLVDIPEKLSARSQIGVAPTGPFLPWNQARTWVREANWKALMLTADEMDNNVDLQEHGALNERWEGVLNDSTESFPQVGGPSAGPFNRRAEVDHDNSGHGKLYYSPVDRRLHLLGAEAGAQKIDFDLDGRVDMTIRTGDRSGHGYMDVWEVDVDADGDNDLTYGYLQRQNNDLRVPHQDLPQDSSELAAFYIAERQRALAENVALIDCLRAILESKEKDYQEDGAEKFYRDGLVKWRADAAAGAKMRASIETERFYSDIIRHRYFARLMQLKLPELNNLARIYWTGEPLRVVAELKRIFPDVRHAASNKHAASVTVTNNSALKQWRQSVQVDLRAAFPGTAIALDGVSVWDPRRHLHPLPVLSQADDLDGDGAADELVFSVDLLPGESVTFALQPLAPAPMPVRAQARADAKGASAENLTSTMALSPAGLLRFTGKDAYAKDSAEPGPGVDVLSLENLAKLDFTVVRDGPLRSILRATNAPLLLLSSADRAWLEIRWSGPQPLVVRPAGPAQAAATPLLEASGFHLWERFDGDLATAIFWRGKDAKWDESRQILTTTGSLWIHAWWRGGDQAPLWPARSNWTSTLERLAARLDGLSAVPTLRME
jgi:hypothetical protein